MGKRQIRLVRWKGEEGTPINHQHDYRWIENEAEREEWVRKYWVVKYV